MRVEVCLEERGRGEESSSAEELMDCKINIVMYSVARFIAESAMGQKKQEISGPDQVLEIASGFQKSRILLTAFELDIFTAIGGESLSSADVAHKIGARPKSTDRMLNALCAMGLLAK